MLMIVKLVTCGVPSGKRDRFAQGQCAWATLSGVAGFCGQVGGWRKDEAGQAVIVGFRHDQAIYDGLFVRFGGRKSCTTGIGLRSCRARALKRNPTATASRCWG